MKSNKPAAAKPAAAAAAAKPAAAKPAKPAKPAALLIIDAKNGTDIHRINAHEVATVTAAELDSATSTMAQLCINLIAGKVDSFLTDAHAKRGGLARLLANWSNADLNALRTVMDSDVKIRAARWEEYALARKRVRVINLQALAKAIKGAKPAGEGKISLRDALQAWANDAGEAGMQELPESMFDLLTEYGITPEAADGDEE